MYILVAFLIIGFAANVIPPPMSRLQTTRGVGCGSAPAAQVPTHWTVQLAPGLDPRNVSFDGFTYVGPVGFLPDMYVYRASATQRRSVFPRSGKPEVVFAEQQVHRMRFRRIADPFYQNQWHLWRGFASVEADHEPTGYNGSGITIAIVDDGLQHTHPDLKGNYDARNSWDFNGNDPDPTPESSQDGHGTAAAGVAAAIRENGHCGRGVAPSARLVGLRGIAEPIDDTTEGQMLSYNAIGVVDIFSCSWGPYDDGITMDAPGYVLQSALATYAGQMRGRLGKGTIYIWAAGNGRANGDSCAFDGYAGSPFVMAIGATTHTGGQAWYSESCSALMAVTPSSGDRQGITTVDLMGAAGYDPSECTASFGGTSSAAPLAAGIVALVLQARPDFTWRDVKHVVAKGAVQIKSEDPDWHVNARGYKHSHKYGFGLLKVPAIMMAVRTHQLVPNRDKRFTSGLIPLIGRPYLIPCVANYTVRNSGITFIEHVVITISINHEARGHVSINMTSPEGTVSQLATVRPKDQTAHYPAGGWKFTSVRHWGESRADGMWIVTTGDEYPRTTGRGHLNGMTLEIWGY